MYITIMGVYRGGKMKNISLLVWLTQLGLSVAVPLAGFILLALYLRNSCGWGSWVIFAGTALGIICAVQGLRSSLKTMERLAKDETKDKPPVSFNDHE